MKSIEKVIAVLVFINLFIAVGIVSGITYGSIPLAVGTLICIGIGIVALLLTRFLED